MRKNGKIEILAPAGSREMLRAAVFSGADAVYLGFAGFNARATAENFDAAALKEAVAFCHARGVRVHTALNTTVYDEELNGLAQAVWSAADAGADALIVQDLAVAKIAKSVAPGLSLHGSTQMSIHSLQGALQAAELGLSRVILARELSRSEIDEITRECPIETEIFVHGALCMSVSGQCYMSAFLGGRSGNRGSCAGTCRLPFNAGAPRKDVVCHHLSLKDNSLLHSISEIQQLGVASVKIEGRLRTPEYVAAAVSAAKASRDGLPFDDQLLRDVFSRSGFTSAYFDGKIDGNMFGVRTKEDSEASKAALPKLRELYRREYSRVPVDMTLTVESEGAKLHVADRENHSAVVYGEQIPQPAEKDPAENLKKSLSKTGGTPFVPGDIQIEMQDGRWYLPGSAVNELRRRGLEQLEQKRGAVVSKAERVYTPKRVHTAPAGPKKQLVIRLQSLDQWSDELSEKADLIALPIAEALKAEPVLCPKILAELPRVMFGGLEKQVARQITEAKQKKIFGFVAENAAHIRMCRGLTTYGGFGLNITNSLSAEEYRGLGLAGLTLLPELTGEQASDIRPGIPTAVMAYGHMPLMITRACPLQNVHTCAGCGKEGLLTDRKNRQFPVRCGLGVRTIYNPVPIYMGDKQEALNTDAYLLYFTIETGAEVLAVVNRFQNAEPFDGEFTRGLYFKGTQSANDALSS